MPKRFAQPFMTKIDLHRFVELEADDEQGESSGWCVAGQPLDLGLHQEQVILHGYVVLALRVDRWRIPRPQFKAQVEEAVAMWRERTGREKISKKDKDELKFRVERKLRKKVLPRMRHYDMCWNVDTGTVLLWSRSPRVKEDFRELFEKTFELELDEDSPYMAAKRLQPAAADALSELQPSFPVDEVD